MEVEWDNIRIWHVCTQGTNQMSSNQLLDCECRARFNLKPSDIVLWKELSVLTVIRFDGQLNGDGDSNNRRQGFNHDWLG